MPERTPRTMLGTMPVSIRPMRRAGVTHNRSIGSAAALSRGAFLGPVHWIVADSDSPFEKVVVVCTEGTRAG